MTHIDTIEYTSAQNAEVRIDLYRKSATCWIVNVAIGGHIQSRSFATEAAANNYICQVQA